VTPPPAEASAGSTLDDVIAMWNSGSSELPAAPVEGAPQSQQPAGQSPAGESTLGDVLANWDAMNNYNDMNNYASQPAINNNAATPTSTQPMGLGADVTTVTDKTKTGLWGHGPSVDMTGSEWKDPAYEDGGITSDGWNGKLMMPKKLNKKQMKKWCRKHDIPPKDCHEGYGWAEYDPSKTTDLHYIMENFDDKTAQQKDLDHILGAYSGATPDKGDHQTIINGITDKLKMAKDAAMKKPVPMEPDWQKKIPSTGPYPGPPVETWEPKCIAKSLKAEKPGAKGQECMVRDQAICRDEWSFGIAPSTNSTNNSTNYYVQAWHESEGIDWPLFQDFEGAIELCVGSSKKHDDTSYMTVTTKESTWYLICPGVGNADKDPKLKITNGNTIDIVNFQRGSGDDAVMWQIIGEGMDQTNPWCLWEEVPHAQKPMPSPWGGMPGKR
jgi:hypothetical protein